VRRARKACCCCSSSQPSSELVKTHTHLHTHLLTHLLTHLRRFVGVLTTLQHALPPGAPRDAGLGLFFASSVLIGAADVFATSQVGMLCLWRCKCICFIFLGVCGGGYF
jgi:hypothetical protein